MPAAALAGVRACVFDAYGTLLDLGAAIAGERQRLGDKADALSALWRRKQLEYTWLRSLMGRHADFWQVTGEALDYGLEHLRLADPGLADALMAAYLRLAPYPEVAAMLERLAAAGMPRAVLSNGAPDMLRAGVASAGLGPLLDHVLSVEEVGVFKPDPRVYRLAVDRLGVAAGEIAFMSANAWDIAGAACFGLRCVWVNRQGAPRERLPGIAVAEQADLAGLPELLGL